MSSFIFNAKDSASITQRSHEAMQTRAGVRRTSSRPDGDSRYILIKPSEPAGKETVVTTQLYDVPQNTARPRALLTFLAAIVPIPAAWWFGSWWPLKKQSELKGIGKPLLLDCFPLPAGTSHSRKLIKASHFRNLPPRTVLRRGSSPD